MSLLGVGFLYLQKKEKNNFSVNGPSSLDYPAISFSKEFKQQDIFKSILAYRNEKTRGDMSDTQKKVIEEIKTKTNQLLQWESEENPVDFEVSKKQKIDVIVNYKDAKGNILNLDDWQKKNSSFMISAKALDMIDKFSFPSVSLEQPCKSVDSNTKALFPKVYQQLITIFGEEPFNRKL